MYFLIHLKYKKQYIFKIKKLQIFFNLPKIKNAIFIKIKNVVYIFIFFNRIKNMIYILD